MPELRRWIMLLIKYGCACGSIIIGFSLTIFWIVAAHDKGVKEGSMFKCKGCFQIYHEIIINNAVGSEQNADVYYLLITFGTICGVIWIATGTIGLNLKTKLLMLLYLCGGILAFAIFITGFFLITSRSVKYILGECGDYCYNEGEWQKQNMNNSFQLFWYSSMACFVLGVFQILSAIYIYAKERVYHYSQI